MEQEDKHQQVLLEYRRQLKLFHGEVKKSLGHLKDFLSDLAGDKFNTYAYQRLSRVEIKRFDISNTEPGSMQAMLRALDPAWKELLGKTAEAYKTYSEAANSYKLTLAEYQHSRATYDMITQYTRYADIFSMIAIYDPTINHQ